MQLIERTRYREQATAAFVIRFFGNGKRKKNQIDKEQRNIVNYLIMLPTYRC